MNLFQRREPSTWERLLNDPLLTTARWLYQGCTSHASSIADSPATPSLLRVVCISDTHNHHIALGTLPSGDILIHAGDLTQSGTVDEVQSALRWLSEQPHPHKLLIAGNHDQALAEESPTRRDLLSEFPGLKYLHDSTIEVTVRQRTLSIYGSPLTPKHGNWPMQYERDRADWSRIPLGTDILVTHGPPAFHLDGEWHSGCRALLNALWSLRPRLHVFGHIHVARGVEEVTWDARQHAFERFLRYRGLWHFVQLVFAMLRPQKVRAPRTTLVNAASAGGFRDEPQARGCRRDNLSLKEI
ncbi:Metallo-dependent phosphatase [Auriculariales sp. MPI-PUGE-AT-0066]|nr:Metallo-dependent phosphatase [Auriculariales sp. MPI-PUGE-AT-0066]